MGATVIQATMLYNKEMWAHIHPVLVNFLIAGTKYLTEAIYERKIYIGGGLGGYWTPQPGGYGGWSCSSGNGNSHSSVLLHLSRRQSRKPMLEMKPTHNSQVPPPQQPTSCRYTQPLKVPRQCHQLGTKHRSLWGDFWLSMHNIL